MLCSERTKLATIRVEFGCLAKFPNSLAWYQRDWDRHMFAKYSEMPQDANIRFLPIFEVAERCAASPS